MNTKYNIGQHVLLAGKILKINISENSEEYIVELITGDGYYTHRMYRDSIVGINELFEEEEQK